MTDKERQELATIGIELITGGITEDVIKQAVIDSYVSLRAKLSAEQLEYELLDTIAELYTLLAVREATIGAMAEVIDELE